jgi:V8-like Glu-specific endopeptidase
VLEPRGALRLRYLTGPERGTTAVLRPPRSRIGRSRDNDIVLADRTDAQASGHHAEAVREGRQWWIHDLQSTNGTALNGTRITRAPFGPGDRLRFGDIECEVLRGRFVLAVTLATLLIVGAAAYAFTVWRQPTFETVAASVARSVYLVAVERRDARQLIGTAFVVGEDVLATNAHVAAAVQASLEKPGQRGIVVRGDSGTLHAIDEIHVSPSWRGSLSGDVALLRVSGLPADAQPLPLADAATLAALARGTIISTFGFPASSTDVMRPRGRLSRDVLGDVRDGQYLAVGLRIAPGTSGSPIFLPNGLVVGLVAGGDFVVAPDGRINPSGTNANWGISVAPLQQLIRECEAERR